MDSKVLESLMIPEYEIATEGIKDKIKGTISMIKATGKITNLAFDEFKKMQSKELKSSKLVGKSFEAFINTIFKQFSLSPEWKVICANNNIRHDLLSKWELTSNKVENDKVICNFKLASCTDEEYRKYESIINKLIKSAFRSYPLIVVKVEGNTPNFIITFKTTYGKANINNSNYWAMNWVVMNNLNTAQMQIQQQMMQDIQIQNQIMIQQMDFQNTMTAVSMTTPGMPLM